MSKISAREFNLYFGIGTMVGSTFAKACHQFKKEPNKVAALIEKAHGKNTTIPLVNFAYFGKEVHEDIFLAIKAIPEDYYGVDISRELRRIEIFVHTMRDKPVPPPPKPEPKPEPKKPAEEPKPIENKPEAKPDEPKEEKKGWSKTKIAGWLSSLVGIAGVVSWFYPPLKPYVQAIKKILESLLVF